MLKGGTSILALTRAAARKYNLLITGRWEGVERGAWSGEALDTLLGPEGSGESFDPLGRLRPWTHPSSQTAL